MEVQTYSEPGPGLSADAWNGAWPQSQGDFERLVDIYLQPLVQFAFRRLRNIHDAEDVVQEVFVRSYARRFECAKVTRVGAYLYRMTANGCTDVLRKRKRTGMPEDACALEGLPDGREDASALYAAAEEIRRAEELLKRLPKKQAEVIRLRAWDGLRVNEIADVIGCSANTVSSRLRYGFQKLRSIVSKEWKR